MPRKEKVIKVIDGDTFITDKRKHPIRLANVDTPEKGESGFQKAKNALEKMIKNKEVSIDTKARDKFSRSVANVKVGNKSINKSMQRYKK